MRTIILCSMFVLVVSLQSAGAGEKREIELYDGSTITGEVLSLNSGVYTIKTDSLGTLKVEESKIRIIRPVSFGAATAPNKADTAGKAQVLQEKILTDTEAMSLILSLQNDPEFQKILEDPEIVRAVKAGDVAALTANPAFMKLLKNANVQEIQKKIK